MGSLPHTSQRAADEVDPGAREKQKRADVRVRRNQESYQAPYRHRRTDDLQSRTVERQHQGCTAPEHGPEQGWLGNVGLCGELRNIHVDLH